MSRTNNATKNVVITFSLRILSLIFVLMTRIFFVNILGNEILGISSVFSSLLVILSIAEFGFGEAVAFILYKPIKDNDYTKIGSILGYVRKAYLVIALLIITAGLFFIPFLHLIIGVSINLENIYLIYLLIVLQSATGYLGSARRILLGIDQKKYKEAIMQFSVSLGYNIIQILLLYLYNSIILYLIMQVSYVIIENIFGAILVRKEYPWLYNQKFPKLNKADVSKIQDNLSPLLLQKFQGIVHSSLPNILLSIYHGTSTVGIYSNYAFVINTTLSLLNTIYSSILGGIGNAIVSKSCDDAFTLFKKIDFISFWIYSIFTIGLYVLFNPFINIAYGELNTINQNTVLLLAISFYILGMRQPVVSFKNSYGFYKQDKYKPIANVVVNIVVSLLLVRSFGIAGVVIGAMLSYLLVNSWIEPLVLFKNGFGRKSFQYIFLYCKRLLLTISLFLVIKFLTGYILFDNQYINFLVSGISTLVITNLTFILIFYNNSEFIFFRNMLNIAVKKLITNRNN